MILRYFLMIGLMLCGFSQQSAIADHVSCDEGSHYLEWTQEHFDSADAVFLGKVVTEETLERSAQPAASTVKAKSMTELLKMIETGQSLGLRSDRIQTASFQIQKSWKGSVEPTIMVMASLYLDDTGYHSLLSTEHSYLVFAYNGDDEEALYVPVGCSSDQSLEETASRIRVLDALTKKPGDR